MLSKRGADLVFLAILTAVLAACCGLVLSIAWFGLDAHLFSRWVKATALGWIAGYPVALLTVGAVRRFSMSLAR